MTTNYQNHPRLDSTVEEGIKGWIDLLSVGIAIIAAYVVRFEQMPSGALSAQMLWMFATLPVLRLFIGRWSNTHRSCWRLFGLAEGWALTRTVLGVTVLLMASRLVMPSLLPEVRVIPLGVIALEGTFSLVMLLGVRVLVRMHDEQRARRSIKRTGKTARALLVGAGRAGRMAARELRARPDAGYEPVGFLDDDPLRVGKVVEGVPVLGSTARAAVLAREVEADVLILTMPSAGRAQTRAVATRCRAAGLPIRTVPGLYELLGGKVEITSVRPLKIEDLLGRDVVGFDDLSARRVSREFTGRRILVTGAGGSIGSELCRQLAELQPATLVLVDNHENHLFEIEQELLPKLGKRVVPCLVDVREVAEVEETFSKHRPEIVFHAAAFKHVPMMESHPTKAVLNNVRGTRVVAQAARAFGAERFLLISTDKAVNPTSVMGATKRAAEILVLGMSGGPTRYSAVRFGNVLGSNGSVVHTFGRQIAEGGPITLTHPEITRYFMTIPEASRLVLQATAVGKGGDLFILDMGEPVKIMDLARQMIRLSGFEEEEIGIKIVGLRPGEKLYEELLADHEERHKQRLATLGTFAAALMHDLRSPLSTVRLDMQLLQRSTAPQQRASFSDAIAALDRVLNDLSGTLDFTRPLELDIANVDLVELARAAVASQSSRAERQGVRLELELPKRESVPVRGDRSRLLRVLENLVRNALDVSPRGATITTGLTVVSGDAVLTVTDEGAGIDPELGERIFEPFVTTKREGVGLGLAIVRKIIEAHDGEISVEGRDVGTRMTVTLPVARNSSPV